MIYLKIDEEGRVIFPYSPSTLKRENPNISFPDPIDENTLLRFNVHRVTETTVPDFDGATHQPRQSAELIDGVWTQVWTVVELSLTLASDNVRRLRDSYLSESDWTQIPNNPLSPEDETAWANYRELLRQIPQQTGFPYSVQWPSKPQ